MTSIRLPVDLENKLASISEKERVTKSEIIKEAIKKYLDEYFDSESAYEAGKGLFGKYGSGETDNSTNYKIKLKDKIRAKHSN